MIKRWGNFRDGIVLEDLAQSYTIAQRIQSSDSYLPADFLFIEAAYHFARGESSLGKELCGRIQTEYPGYDPSLRFVSFSDIPPGRDLSVLFEELTQLQVAEDFLLRLLEAHSSYQFQEFSSHFSLSRELSRENLLEKITFQKEDIREKG